MFQGIKNVANSLSSMNKMRQQQARMQKMLQEVEVVGYSKNKKVEITVNGEHKIIKMFVDPTLIKFVVDNFYAGEQISDEQLEKGQKFLNTSIKEAFEDAVPKVQEGLMKKMQESGNLGEMMSMLGGMGA
jgi:DNA-binding protein YbaB